MIKNILFDMGGVVFRQHTEVALQRFSALGIEADRVVGAYGQQGFFLDFESGRIDEEGFCRAMSEAAGREVTIDEARHCCLGFVGEVPTELLRHLLELKERYHLALLSNTNPFVMGFTRSTAFSSDGRGIGDYFHSQFCSYEVGICKPSAEIYLKALAADGMVPEETVFVDDGATNIAAAKAVGIHALLVEQNSDWRQPLADFIAQI